MEEAKIFRARNLRITNYLLANGCKMLSVEQNNEFSSKKGGYCGKMLIFNFEVNEHLDTCLKKWNNDI